METQVAPEPTTSPAEAAPSDDRPPAEPRPGLLARRGHLLPWVLVPVVVSIAYLLLPGVTELRSQYQASALVLVSAPALGWLLTRRSRLAHHTAGAWAAALLPGLALISLHGTEWFFSGPFGDQSFRLEYATRFADDLGSLSDYTYQGVPAFYSPGWFWVVGLAARLTGLEAWQAYKWVGIGTLYLAGVAAFALWRRTCGTRLSAVLTTVTIVGLPAAGVGWLGKETLFFAGAYEPYGFLVVLPMPALLAWFAVATGRYSWKRGVLLGVALGAAAWLYLLYALVAVVAVVALGVWRFRDTARVREVLTAGATCAVLLAPWLGRFLVEWIAAGTPPAVATTWIDDDSFVHLFSGQPTPWILLALVGAVGALVLRGGDHPRLRACQALAGTIVLFGVLQLVAGQAARGVLFHRLLILLGVALLAAGTLTLAAVGPELVAWARRVRPGLALGRLGFALLTLLLFLNLSAHQREFLYMGADLRKLAHDVPYPDGRFPALAQQSTIDALGDDVTIDQLADRIRGTAREAGQPTDAVLLTDDISLLATKPFYGYLQWWELYSNPLGEYVERRQFVESLEGLSGAELADRLRSDPEGPRLFALAVGEDGDTTVGSAAWIPATRESPVWRITLPTSAFDDQDFVTTRVGNWFVAALRTR